MAGFVVTGVDIDPQPNYPFEFIQADALQWLAENLHGLWQRFDLIHASPPCQAYSRATAIREGAREKHPDLVEPVRQLLEKSTIPYVIENVPGSPLRADIKLWGWLFGLPLIRERWFELGGWFAMQPAGQKPAGTAHAGDFVTVAGQGMSYNSAKGKNGPQAAIERRVKCWKGSVLETWRYAMDIPWAETRKELSNACPPAYAEWIGMSFMHWHRQSRGIRVMQSEKSPTYGTDYCIQVGDRRMSTWKPVGQLPPRLEKWLSRHEQMAWTPVANQAEFLDSLRASLRDVYPIIRAIMGDDGDRSPAPVAVPAGPLCANCNEPFSPKNAKGRYCGTACRTAACRKRSKALPPPTAPINAAEAPPPQSVADQPWVVVVGWEWLEISYKATAELDAEGMPLFAEYRIRWSTALGAEPDQEIGAVVSGWQLPIDINAKLEYAVNEHELAVCAELGPKTREARVKGVLNHLAPKVAQHFADAGWRTAGLTNYSKTQV